MNANQYIEKNLMKANELKYNESLVARCNSCKFNIQSNSEYEHRSYCTRCSPYIEYIPIGTESNLRDNGITDSTNCKFYR